MTDIVEFLTARLRDDEAYALEAAEEFGPDWIEIWSGQIDLSANLPERQPPAGRHWDAHVQTNDSRVSRYMVRHDPARVLAEVKAKRALMALHGLETLSHQPAQYELPEGFAGEFVGYCQLCSDLDYPEGLATYYEPWPCPSMRILASVYDQHPDYKQEWSVE